MAKEQELLIAKAEIYSLRHLQSIKANGNRHLLDVKQQELQLLQSELDRRDIECSQLRSQLSKGREHMARKIPGDTAELGPMEVRIVCQTMDVV